jgi:hypothetical protein
MLVVSSCTLLENTDRRVTGEYVFSIKPDTILQSIVNREEGVFSPVSDESELTELYPNSVSWRQSDYLHIADALHTFVWNESLQDWNLDHMSFLLPCNQVGTGFQQASFSFFRNNAIDENSEIEHQIDIYPGRKTINAWEFVYNSKLIRMNSLEVTAGMLTAEEALTGAESNGGLENRVALGNKCETSVMLSPNTVDHYEWKIYYSPGDYTITLDPFTGELIK